MSIVGTDFDTVDGSNPALPDDKSIVRQCREAIVASLRADHRAHIRGVKVANPVGPPVWVKFGDVSLSEARTQHYVAQVVSRNRGDAPVRVPAVYRFFQDGGRGYIVMDFVDGSVCTRSDAQAIATAVSFLITIPAPADQRSPGPIGGGPICHDFFIDRKSPVTYPTVELLTAHINGSSFWLIAMSKPDSTAPVEESTCQPRSRGPGTRPAPLPLGYQPRELHGKRRRQEDRRDRFRRVMLSANFVLRDGTVPASSGTSASPSSASGRHNRHKRQHWVRRPRHWSNTRAT
ncbi:uncharacterized protein SCHCODRAFT_02310144 [Schizophyllum commune H4-8]|uniref:uncharacterized protein n=1 Tax=Schizophyllum commune (strain H4-8 / FGSC 9210) TaxID=578458 RepID=UPI00215E3718|nr:uncharacterized protein SCHCODRAFT_02310144 [Schizophyllum commune H4-8]KAI5891077.1 hypothetical protein SCHCODRAFT_02310144 [Schizophyllum commune H4-8]